MTYPHEGKPWLFKFLDQIGGYPTIEQSLALALAAQADDNGLVESVDYEALTDRSAISRDMARKLLRHSVMASNGLIQHIPRVLNNRPLSPSVKLKV